MTWETTPTLIAAREAYYAELDQIEKTRKAAEDRLDFALHAEETRRLAHYLAIYEADGWPNIRGYRESFLASCRVYGVVAP